VKRCAACGEQRSLTEFSWKNSRMGTRSAYCRPCMRQYVREHYSRNTDYYVAKAKRSNAAYRDSVFRKVLEALLANPCVDCGEGDPLVLEFDHKDGESKECAISEMIRRQRACTAVEAEIAKCEIRCASCHRRRTARQQGWMLGVPKSAQHASAETPTETPAGD